MLIKNTIRKITAILITVAMVLGVFPWQEIAVAFAAPTVTKIEITKIYDGNYNLPSHYYLTVYGSELNNLEVKIQGDDGKLTNLTPSSPGTNIVQYTISTSQVGSKFLINGALYEIVEDDMPQLKGVTSKLVQSGQQLGISGLRLNKIDTVDDANGTIRIQYYQGITEQDISTVMTHTDDSQTTKNVTIVAGLGVQNLKVVKKYNQGTVGIEISYRYLDAFRIYDLISGVTPGDIVMNPTKGKKGDKVTLSTDTFPEDYSVFLIENLEDPFLGKNLGEGIENNHSPSQKDTITFKVPSGLELKTYNVILTNYVNPSGVKATDNLSSKIVKQLVLGTFTIVDGTFLPQIQSVQPNTGPDSGSEVIISGKFFEELNIDNLTGFQDNSIGQSQIVLEERNSLKQLRINYPSDANTKYNGKQVTVTRYISAIIGSAAEFQDKTKQTFNFGANQFDTLTVMSKPLELGDKDLSKDVIVNLETVITEVSDPTKVYIIKEQALKADAYTYIPSFTEPIINTVAPNVIGVKKEGVLYKTATDVIIALNGKDFHVYKFTNDSGQEKIVYPKVVLGGNSDSGEIMLKRISDKVYYRNKVTGIDTELAGVSLEIVNDQGKVTDGTVGNEIGTRIIVMIPAGLEIDGLKVNASPQSVAVANPIRGSENYGPYTVKADVVQFIATDDVPIIEEVTPNVVTLDGNEDIVVKGSNFASDVKVYIDGKEVTGLKRNGIGTQIDFKSPPGREGDTLVYVLNPTSGGVATYPFKYVRTYTNPKITDFSPKKGKTGTLVVITGENFIKPDPTALEKDIFKLVGTRVMLDGKDINQYYRDSVTKQIKLQNFVGAKKILQNNGGQLIMEDYAHSIILKDMVTGRFYTMTVDGQGKPLLSNGIDQKFTLRAEGAAIKADKDGGGVYDVTLDVASDAGGNYDYIHLVGAQDITLKVMTPYIVQSGVITGNNVKVVGIDKIYFTVPILEADGYYDVTIENPDTKKDSKMDQAGFYYYTQPSSKPKIKTIEPEQGSVDGGYLVKITGEKEAGKECFIDNGVEKTKVFINGVEVPQSQISISVDGLTIEAVVPKLNVDLRAKYNTDRLSVPVVVVNPDGGSDSKENGFTYIVPTSHPEIIKIVPQKGNAAGNEIVEITGKDFRFYEPYNDTNRDQAWNLGEEYRDLNGSYYQGGASFIADTGIQGPDDFTSKPMNQLKTDLGDTNYKNIVLPVLPKVYFGTKQAEVLEFSNGYLKVRTPSGKIGDVDVYVVNNDSGISNKLKFTYEGSNPKINKIIPAEGKKQGGEKVEFFGTGFSASDIQVYYRDTDGIYKQKPITQALVRFGSIFNNNIPREQQNSGRIDNNRTTVKLDGGLTVSYDGSNPSAASVTISILEDQKTYTVTIPYNGDAVYVPVSLLQYTNAPNPPQSYVGNGKGDEWVRLEILDRRLLVERGYAPVVEYRDSAQVVVTTPSYYTVGQVSVTLINPDGGVAESKFTYKNPSSQPTVTNITKDGRNPSAEIVNGQEMRIVRVTYKGGNLVSILGTDFRENATIQIGDALTINKEEITYQLPSKLTFKMPKAPDTAIGKRHRVVVMNEDGGNASSDLATPPIYIEFIKGETAPAIEEVTPAKGPASGGTTVTIKGKDFREGLQVFFGEKQIPGANVTVVDYKTIRVVTPVSVPGVVEVKVENPDGELADPTGKYTFLSTPSITAVVSASDPTETSRIRTISILGDEVIKLKGAGFLEGAKVIFGPQLELVTDEKDIEKALYIQGKYYTLKQGTEGSKATLVNGETLTVTTPQGKKGTSGVLVINSDGGATTIYGDLQYGTPSLTAPTGVVAELVYDRYIKVNWNSATDAKEYEVYVIMNNKVRELIGNTELTSFVYEDLEPYTTYKFVVTAVGEYGSSPTSTESNSVTTKGKVGPPDNDGKLGEKNKIEKIGDRAEIVIGAGEDTKKDIIIDLTKGTLAGSKDVIISIPASVVATARSGSVVVNGKDFSIKFNPNTFYNDKIRDNRNKSEAGIRVEISPIAETSVIERNTSGQTALSTPYSMKAYVFVGKDRTELEYVQASIQITLDIDRVKADMRKLQNFTLNRYDGYENTWAPIGTGKNDAMAISALTDRLGKFVILGSRR
ncbi:IPT/TIG domain-containing protein [Anaerosolibacter sp.]|uniref:IPT/TIG domain-containing protein n=1 Tax=Anaerosolibacter sp. TaxID=1872527 RepID=UPI0039EEDC4B